MSRAPRIAGFADLIGRMSEGTDDESKVHPIDPMAQAMELRDRFRRGHLVTLFQPGMLCREKRGLGILKHDPLVMFWRWLDPTDAQDAAMIDDAARKRDQDKVDCLIGFIDADSDMNIFVHESWRLEPCDDYPDDGGAA